VRKKPHHDFASGTSPSYASYIYSIVADLFWCPDEPMRITNAQKTVSTSIVFGNKNLRGDPMTADEKTADEATPAPAVAKASSAPRKALRPRDAATLIILDTSSGSAKVLLGKRRDDAAFMPGKYVFPGGRVDRADRHIPFSDDLRSGELEKLMLGVSRNVSCAKARALALAAVRETFEETGLIIGASSLTPRKVTNSAWQKFFAAGFVPALARLTFFARAITPPGRPRRFDARFFCVDANAISHSVPFNDGELSGLDWMTIEEARSLDLARITRMILQDLGDRIAAGRVDASELPVPFYRLRYGSFRRDLLERPIANSEPKIDSILD
jgi:8-oxo-dGTP pyrophosphatase MutT (NUDIX family)